MVLGSAFHALMQGHYESFRDADATGEVRSLVRARDRARLRLNVYYRTTEGRIITPAMLDQLRYMYADYCEIYGTDDELDRFVVIDERRVVPLVETRGIRVLLQCTADLVAHHRKWDKWLLLDHKEQPNSEVVATPDGWIPIGNLRVGDKLLGSDGGITTVTNLFPKGVQPVYRLTMTDGSTVRAGAGHLWYVGFSSFSKPKILTTLELIPLVEKKASRRQISLITDPLEFTEKDLPVDPYTLGYLLGNAYLGKNTPSLTIHQNDFEEIMSYLDTASLGIGTGEYQKIRLDGSKSLGKTVMFSTTSRIYISLKSLGLIGITAPQKHIPHQYLVGSVDQRYALLRGLMDSDGSSSKRNSRFITTSPKLAQQITELIWSLGGRARYSRFTPVITNYTPLNPLNDAYSVYVTTEDNPHRLERKADLRDQQVRRDWVTRTIDSIEQVLDEECTCIEVDAVDHLYVTAHSILTHNTKGGVDASKEPFKNENQLDPQRKLYAASFTFFGERKSRLPIFAAYHNIIRTDKLKREMTRQERYSRTPIFYTELELMQAWEETQEVAKRAVEIQLGVGPKIYSSPDPMVCSWRCSFARAHVTANSTGRDIIQLAVDYGAVRNPNWTPLAER